MKVLEYQLIEGHGTEDLNKKVADLIKQQWQPFKSPTVYAGTWFLQAMVKYESEYKNQGWTGPK